MFVIIIFLLKKMISRVLTTCNLFADNSCLYLLETHNKCITRDIIIHKGEENKAFNFQALI
jgi:hypothetical protein